jgi:DNA-binding transcriptional MerR regulator/methylmalonyl-CoA mutase cobalamin-binding subunit
MAGEQEQEGSSEHGGRLTIGSLSRATGIPVETLRTWEHRYGFPRPERKESGHRLYPLSTVRRLLRVTAALARGHRAAEVVPASDEVLDSLLSTPLAKPGRRESRAPARSVRTREEVAAGAASLGASDHEALAAALSAVVAFDAARLTRHLERAWAELGPLAFLRRRIAPLVEAAGEGWARRELEIRHEHFLTERVGDLLRAMRLPFEEKAAGGCVVLATLPGEAHTLGLQMSALALALGGCRVVYLGPEVPVPEAVAIVRELDAVALGLSVSAATGGAPTPAMLARVRRLLPRRTALLVGGAGAPVDPPRGVLVLKDLGEPYDWAREQARRPASRMNPE